MIEWRDYGTDPKEKRNVGHCWSKVVWRRSLREPLTKTGSKMLEEDIELYKENVLKRNSIRENSKRIKLSR